MSILLQEWGDEFMHVTDLRTNHLIHALGVCPDRMVLSWRLPDCATVVAVQVHGAAAPEKLESETLLWDSGWTDDVPTILAWGGPEPLPRQRVWWRVRARDRAGVAGPWSETAWFEAPLTDDDFKGSWITMEGVPTPLFRCSQHLPFEPSAISRARWYLAVGGLAEVYVNGTRHNTGVLQPDHVDYAQRVSILAFDVRDSLQRGANVLSLVLGGGWFEHHGYGRRCFRSQFEVDTHAGENLILAAEPGDWQVRQGPWTAESIVHGEWYDGRLWPSGWQTPDYVPDAAWHSLGRSFGKPPNAAEPPGGVGTGIEAPPIVAQPPLTPERIALRDNVATFDFKENFTGMVEFTGHAPAGTTLYLRASESLHDDGRIDTRTNKGARGVNGYTFRGDGPECWRPSFSYQGLRYLEVQSTGELPEDLCVRGFAVRSACPRRAAFSCDNAELTALFEMSMRTIESNLLGLLTDCPQRDERQGWLGDAWAVSPVVLNCFDSLALYRKWMRDMVGIQDPGTGWRWSPTAPPSPMYLSRPPRQRSRRACSDVLAQQPQSDSVYTAAVTIIPWQYYRASGEPGHLDWIYPTVAAHLHAMRTRTDFPLPDSSWHGDHAAMGITLDPPTKTPAALVAAAVLLYEYRIAARMADRLGYGDQSRDWRETAREIAHALRHTYFDQAKGSFGTQGADALALDLGFAPEGEVERVRAALVGDLAERGCLTSGLVTTPSLLRALTESGHEQTVLDVLLAEGEPGFVWMVRNGWTTLGEHIVSRWPDTSRSHPGWALICEWMLQALAGIVITEAGGTRVSLAPRIPEPLNSVEATLETSRGRLGISWQRRGTQLDVSLTIPAGVGATFLPPRGYVVVGKAPNETLPPGRHEIACRPR